MRRLRAAKTQECLFWFFEMQGGSPHLSAPGMPRVGALRNPEVMRETSLTLEEPGKCVVVITGS